MTYIRLLEVRLLWMARQVVESLGYFHSADLWCMIQISAIDFERASLIKADAARVGSGLAKLGTGIF